MLRFLKILIVIEMDSRKDRKETQRGGIRNEELEEGTTKGTKNTEKLLKDLAPKQQLLSSISSRLSAPG